MLIKGGGGGVRRCQSPWLNDAVSFFFFFSIVQNWKCLLYQICPLKLQLMGANGADSWPSIHGIIPTPKNLLTIFYFKIMGADPWPSLHGLTLLQKQIINDNLLEKSRELTLASLSMTRRPPPKIINDIFQKSWELTFDPPFMVQNEHKVNKQSYQTNTQQVLTQMNK